MEEGRLVWITGLAASGKTTLARGVYSALRKEYLNTVHLDGDELRDIWGLWNVKDPEGRKKLGMSYARQCRYLTRQGTNVVMSTVALFHDVQRYNRENNPRYCEVLVVADEETLKSRTMKRPSETHERETWARHFEFPTNPHLRLKNNELCQIEPNIREILEAIKLL